MYDKKLLNLSAKQTAMIWVVLTYFLSYIIVKKDEVQYSTKKLAAGLTCKREGGVSVSY